MNSLRKIVDTSISLFLVCVLLAGNLIACAKKESHTAGIAHENTDVFVDPVSSFNAEYANFYADEVTNEADHVISDGYDLWKTDFPSGDTGYINFYSNGFTDEISSFISDNYSSWEGEFDSDEFKGELSDFIVDIYGYRYGMDVKVQDIFVYYTPEEFRDSIETLEPERQINTNALIAKFAIGTVIIIASIIVTVVTGGTATAPVLGIATKYVGIALAGSAVSAAISGTARYIASDGNKEEFWYGAIEGAADGFMWSAFGSAAGTGIKAYNALKPATPMWSTFGSAVGAGIKASSALKPATSNFAKASNAVESFIIPSESAVIASNTVKQAAKPLGYTTKARVNLSKAADTKPRLATPKQVFVQKYGEELYKDIRAYTGKQHSRIQGVLQGTRYDSGYVNGKWLKGEAYMKALKARADRINNFLKSQRIEITGNLRRGENMPKSAVGDLYNIGNTENKSLSQIVKMIKQKGKTENNSTLTSTSLPTVDAETIHGYAINGWGNVLKNRTTNIHIIREFVGNNPKGYNISNISLYKEQEALMPIGLKTKVIDARVETVVHQGEKYKIIRVYESIIP